MSLGTRCSSPTPPAMDEMGSVSSPIPLAAMMFTPWSLSSLHSQQSLPWAGGGEPLLLQTRWPQIQATAWKSSIHYSTAPFNFWQNAHRLVQGLEIVIQIQISHAAVGSHLHVIQGVGQLSAGWQHSFLCMLDVAGQLPFEHSTNPVWETANITPPL